jgi:glycosyltransferase involved in cell wall biosynthesis
MANKDQPLVSIGIPFYNSEDFLSDAIKSTLNQTYQNIELILLDDGSTDTSLKIAHEFEVIDSRVLVITDGQNFGLPKRLNQLSKLAKGKYYGRMDADDIMFPNRIKVQVEYLINNPKIDLLGTGLIAIDNKNNIIGLRKGGSSNQVTLKSTLKGPWAPHPSITGKSKWFKENKYNETLKRAQDFELWIRTVEKSNFTVINQPLLFYREASTSSMVKRVKSTRYSIKTYWKRKNKMGLLYSLKQIFINLVKLIVYFCFYIFGSTDVLIKKRSINLLKNEKSEYIGIMDKALS